MVPQLSHDHTDSDYGSLYLLLKPKFETLVWDQKNRPET